MAATLELSQLQSALALVSGAAQIGPASLPADTAPAFRAFLNRYYGGQPIAFANAVPGPGDGDGQVVVSGTSSFLGLTALPVLGIFSLSADATDVVARLRYTLPVGGGSPWTWSASFPDLPPVYDVSQPAGAPTAPALDRLTFSAAVVEVCTDPVVDHDWNVTLVPGINFVGRANTPDFVPLLSLFEPQALFSGTVVLPDPTHPVSALVPYGEPWEPPVPQPPPGILLTAPVTPPSSIGQLQVSSASLVLYSPTSTDWMLANPGYESEVAFAVTLSVPSAGIAAPVSASLVLGAARAVFSGVFQGLSVGSLASLVDLAGGKDLMTNLPDDVQKLGDAIGRLSLLEAAVAVRAADGEPSVDYAYFTIGMPDVSWTVIDGVLTVTGLSASFAVNTPFQSETRSVAVSLTGTLDVSGVGVEITAGASPFQLTGSTTAPISVPLATILGTYAPNIPDPGTLTIDTLTVGAVPGSWYSLELTAAEQPPWTIQLGHGGVTISDVTLSVDKPVGADATGTFSGSIAIGSAATLAVTYDVPGDFVLQGFFPVVHLSDLVEALCDVTLPLPSGFDLTLTSSSVRVDEQGGNLRLALGTTVNGVGTVVLEVAKTNAGWGFAAGVALTDPLSSLPGLSDLHALESLFSLDQLVLLVSSLDVSTVSLPPASTLPNPPSAGVTLPPQAAQASGPGLFLFAQLDATVPGPARMVSQALDLAATLDVTLQVSVPPTQSSRLSAAVAGSVGPATTFAGAFGAGLVGGEPELFLSGTVRTTIQRQPVEFDAVAAFLPNGALVSGSMVGGPISFWELQLADVALALGIDLEGVPSLGFAATIATHSAEVSLAIFLDSTDPANSLVAGAVSDFTLRDVATVLAQQIALPSSLDDVLGQIALQGTHSFTIPGSVGQSLDDYDLAAVQAAFQAAGVVLSTGSGQLHLIVADPGTTWFLTDLGSQPATHYELAAGTGAISVSQEAQVSIVPQATTIGGLTFAQGVKASGAIDFFGWHAVVDVQLSQGQGIHVDAEADPLTIYSADLLEITADGGGGAGPSVSLDTVTDPHFTCTGQVKLLGVAAADTTVSVTSAGCTFHLGGELVSAATFAIDGSFTSLSDFKAGGSIAVGVQGSIDLSPIGVGVGQIAFDEQVSASLDAGYANQQAWARIAATFDFDGQRSFGPFDLTIGADDLTQVGELLLAQVRTVLTDAAKEPLQWLQWVAAGLVTGVETDATSIGRVLSQTFRLGFSDIITVTQSALSYGVEGFAGALQGAGASIEQAMQLLVDEQVATLDAITSIVTRLYGTHVDVNPHVDGGFAHLDTAPTGHVDSPGSHVDQNAIGHLDQYAVAHVDQKTSFGGHLDHPPDDHADSPPQAHVDSSMPHGDTAPVPHLDQPHQHLDAPQHADATP